MILTKTDFAKPATLLARKLVGKVLCRAWEGEILRFRITETECYFGEEDTACHAHKGKTPRTQTLYEAGGIAYVYLCYGMHHLLNLVTGAPGHPEAVLIRGVEGISGPGRVTRALHITKAENRLPLTPDAGLWVEDDGTPPPEVAKLPRVGIDYAAEKDRERLWRYLAK